MNFQELLDKFGGDALKAMAELQRLHRDELKSREDDNHKLREDKRTLTTQLDKANELLEAEKKRPTVKDGEVVLSAEEAKVYNEVKEAHGGLPKLVEKYGQAEGELAKTAKQREEDGIYTTLVSAGLREDARDQAFRLLRNGESFDEKYFVEKDVEQDGKKVKAKVIDPEKFKEDNSFLFGDGRRPMPKNNASGKGTGKTDTGKPADHIAEAAKTVQSRLKVPEILQRRT